MNNTRTIAAFAAAALGPARFLGADFGAQPGYSVGHVQKKNDTAEDKRKAKRKAQGKARLRNRS